MRLPGGNFDCRPNAHPSATVLVFPRDCLFIGVVHDKERYRQLLAGAKAVVAGLWNVEDQSTTVLMEGFYRRLAEHEDKAMALAHAKRDFLEQNRNLPPYYWAGFVIVGEGEGEISFGN